MKIKQLKDSLPCKFDLSFADMFIRPAMEEFIRWRKTELKKPFKTPRGIHRLYNRLVDFSRGEQDRLQMVVLQSEEKEWTDVYELTNEYEQRLNSNRQGAIYGDATSGNKSTSRKDQSATSQLITLARKVLQ
jgi:hypothetical protein